MEVALKVLRMLLEYEAKPGTNIATLEAMDWWLDVEDDAETFFFGLRKRRSKAGLFQKDEGRFRSRLRASIRLRRLSSRLQHKTKDPASGDERVWDERSAKYAVTRKEQIDEDISQLIRLA